MAKQLLTRGQASIQTLNDAYSINQSVNEYVFTAVNNGVITSAVTFTLTIKSALEIAILQALPLGTLQNLPDFLPPFQAYIRLVF